MSILGGLPWPLLAQGTIGAVPDADATIVASVREGYVILTVASDEPEDSNLRLRRIEGLLEPERTAELADQATGATGGIDRNRGPLPRAYQSELPPLDDPFSLAITTSG
jgi:hypothetical protein